MLDLVSIIVPVYNMEKSLEKCVHSILNQTYNNIEVILVDDGSMDNSFDVCQNLCKEDYRVKCIHTENQGSGPARNAGIAESKGKYIYFPDADDYLEPDAIEILVEAMSKGKYDLIVFGYKCLDYAGAEVFVKKYDSYEVKGEKVRKSFSEFSGMTNKYSVQGAPWNKFFDGEVVRKNNVTYPSLRRHQDEGFIARYVTLCQNIKFIPNVLYGYYQNTASVEWKKYPVDYLEAIIGLKNVWDETIMNWNPQDAETHVLIRKEIFSKTIKALELSYSPKMQLGLISRIKWLKKACAKTNFGAYTFDLAGSWYQKTVLVCTKLHVYPLLAFVLYIGKIKNVIRQGK